jgi:hypothetical protein
MLVEEVMKPFKPKEEKIKQIKEILRKRSFCRRRAARTTDPSESLRHIPKTTCLKRRRGPVVENQGRALKSGMLGETA